MRPLTAGLLVLTTSLLCDSEPPENASGQAAAAPVETRVAPVPAAAQETISFSMGTPEVIFDYSEDACARRERPNVPAKAVRVNDGVVLAAGNQPVSYFMFGKDLNSVRRSCTPVFRSKLDMSADSHRNQGWMNTLYRVGDTVHALVHNEFHDLIAPSCLKAHVTRDPTCWYNTITYAYSTDGARTFVQPADLVVAAPREKWDRSTESGGRSLPMYGYFAPSNIVFKDGFYYFVTRHVESNRNAASSGICLHRTATIGKPASWRAWDGKAFTVATPSAYGNRAATAGKCAPVLPQAWSGMTRSLTYNTYLGKYLLVGEGRRRVAAGRFECGFYYSLSDDLIAWTGPRLMMPIRHMDRDDCTETSKAVAALYPSIIDPADTTVNFERSGQTPFLYFIRSNDAAADDDLMRVTLRIERR